MSEEEVIGVFRGKYDFLSNFYAVSVVIDGVTYNSVEHWYQSMKGKTENDREYVRTAPTSKEAKSRGKQIAVRPDWDGVKIETMKKGLIAKFEQHAYLRRKLLETGKACLREGNWWKDQFWGVDVKTGKGENWLGKLLMEVRDDLRRKEEEIKHG